MNYQRIYDEIIAKAILRTTVNGYYESHHIIPKCMNGFDEPNNIARLTGREFTEEHCKNISIACKGRKSWNDGLKVGPMSDELKAKISAGSKGRIVSEETKLKLKNTAIIREERKRNLLKIDLQNS